jgi:hypothetical protein
LELLFSAVPFCRRKILHFLLYFFFLSPSHFSPQFPSFFFIREEEKREKKEKKGIMKNSEEIVEK